MNLIKALFLVLLSLMSFSCQRNLFRTHNLSTGFLMAQGSILNRSQKIEKFDQLALSVFTRKGELLLDPENVLEIRSNLQQNSVLNPMQMAAGFVSQYSIMANNMRPFFYVVNEDGKADLPAIGKIKLDGLTLLQADSLLSREYQNQGLYKDAYVKTQYLNKRVILLGALGDRVVKLAYENMTVFEVLAQQSTTAGSQFNSTNIQASARSVVIIRNLQTAPDKMQIEEINLRDLNEIYQKNIHVQNGDIIYVRPRMRLDRDVVSEFSVITGIMTSLATVYLLLINLSR
jgi:polysaccharide export outer membrane protein